MTETQVKDFVRFQEFRFLEKKRHGTSPIYMRYRFPSVVSIFSVAKFIMRKGVTVVPPYSRKETLWFEHRLNMELDLQSLFGLHVQSCTHWLRPRNPPAPPIWAHIRWRYWSAKIDDISLCPFGFEE
jgi:hypothetical protein